MRVGVSEAARERLVAPVPDAGEDSPAWQLVVHQGALALQATGEKAHPLSVDFRAGTLGFRLERVHQETLARACGLTRSTETLSIVDATAGLGRDAALLAMAGGVVTLLEENPVLHNLLADGLARADRELAARMNLVFTDSLAWLAGHVDVAEVVYLDPMFPERRKSAAVKKEQRWLQALAGVWTPPREAEMLAAARAAALKRVVVKRPVKAPFLAGEKPHHEIRGKTVRFDVYE